MPKGNGDHPTQETPTGTERKRLDLPGEGGAEIPIPTRDAIEDALGKVAKPDVSNRKRGPKKK